MALLMNMLRAIISEFFKGVFSSLQGFLVLHKIDNPPVIKTEQRQRLQKAVNSHQTVLENRRQREQDKRFSKSVQSENAGRVSTPKRILRCIGLNIASVLLVLALTSLINLLGPSMLSTCITCLGSLLLIPIFVFVRLLSILWFADVAGAALRYRGQTGQKIPDFSRAASDFMHAIFVELVFLLQALILYSLEIPLISTCLGFVYMSLLHSLYSFDYIWMSNGIAMNSRLALIERRWPFHLGFGTILTLATSYSSNFFINGCIFGALFPFFIISSCLAADGAAERVEQLQQQQNLAAIPHLHFYYVAQNLTNKISMAIFGRI